MFNYFTKKNYICRYKNLIMNDCLNCNTQFEGNFCYNCGQSGSVTKMDFHSLWHDIQHGMFHFDKGILFSLKQLVIRPGNAAREYIDGKRVRHFKPISLVIILATFYGFMYHYSGINLYLDDLKEPVKIEGGKNPEKLAELINKMPKINEWIGTHYAIASLGSLLFFSLGSFLAFRKAGYNLVEHVVLNAYLNSLRMFYHILAFPVVYYYYSSQVRYSINQYDMYIDFALAFWVYMQFFKKYSLWKGFLRTMLAYIYFSLLIGIIIVISGALLISYIIT